MVTDRIHALRRGGVVAAVVAVVAMALGAPVTAGAVAPEAPAGAAGDCGIGYISSGILRDTAHVPPAADAHAPGDTAGVGGVYSEADPTGDASGQALADISSYTVRYQETALELGLRTVGNVDPVDSPAFVRGEATISFTLQAGDQTYTVYGFTCAGELAGAVFPSGGVFTSRPYSCYELNAVTLRHDAASGYTFRIPTACIGGGTEAVRVQARVGVMLSPSDSVVDSAPDETFSPWVVPQPQPYWDQWDIARDVALVPDATGGYVLDGWGGLHTYRDLGLAAPADAHGSGYWSGWDIARGVALLPDATGGYVLDGFGGLHPFAVGGNAPPPPAHVESYWPGWDIARGVTFLPDGRSGYVVDGFGGLHRFAVGANALPSPASAGPYWPGWDVARGITATSATGGYVVDAFGGLHAWANAPGGGPGAVAATAYWSGWDIARGASWSGSAHRGVVVDGFGGLHPFT